MWSIKNLLLLGMKQGLRSAMPFMAQLSVVHVVKKTFPGSCVAITHFLVFLSALLENDVLKTLSLSKVGPFSYIYKNLKA